MNASRLATLVRSAAFALSALLVLVLATAHSTGGKLLVSIAFAALYAFIAVRLYGEASPARDTLVIPAQRLSALLEASIAWIGVLFLLSATDPRGETPTFVLAGAVLLLWRPSYQLPSGQPLRRYPMGPWLPWSVACTMPLELGWSEHRARRPPRDLLAYGLEAQVNGWQLDLERASVSSTAEDRETLALQWRERLVAALPQASAAGPRSTIKPWHMLAAMFGLPGVVLALGLGIGPGEEAGAAFSTVAFPLTGALAFWFLSRILPRRVWVGMAVCCVVWIAAKAALVERGVSKGACEVTFDADDGSGWVKRGDRACIEALERRQCSPQSLLDRGHAVVDVIHSSATTCDALGYATCTSGPPRRKTCGPARSQP